MVSINYVASLFVAVTAVSANMLEERKEKTETKTVTTTIGGKPTVITIKFPDPSSDAEAAPVGQGVQARKAFPDADMLREGGVLRARKIKTVTQTHTSAPTVTNPPKTTTKTVTDKAGHTKTETIVIIDPSSAPFVKEAREAVNDEPQRRDFKDTEAVRAGGVLRSPAKRRAGSA